MSEIPEPLSIIQLTFIDRQHDMENRPKIKLTLSPLDNTLERTSKIFLAIIWGLALYALLKLPLTIPTHFTATGQADGYGNKLTLLILPICATIIYSGLT